MTQPDGELRAAIVQDASSGRVLMLAWMDDEAERLTRESGQAWFWSRSRERLWKKGETSGNTLAVVELRDDCDGDALQVAQAALLASILHEDPERLTTLRDELRQMNVRLRDAA